MFSLMQSATLEFSTYLCIWLHMFEVFEVFVTSSQYSMDGLEHMLQSLCFSSSYFFVYGLDTCIRWSRFYLFQSPQYARRYSQKNYAKPLCFLNVCVMYPSQQDEFWVVLKLETNIRTRDFCKLYHPPSLLYMEVAVSNICFNGRWYCFLRGTTITVGIWG